MTDGTCPSYLMSVLLIPADVDVDAAVDANSTKAPQNMYGDVVGLILTFLREELQFNESP